MLPSLVLQFVTMLHLQYTGNGIIFNNTDDIMYVLTAKAEDDSYQ